MIPIESITTGETYGRWPEHKVEELKVALTKAFAIAYISGPMSGLPDLNYPAFFAAEDRIKDQYSKVLNPARLVLDNGQKNTWENWMRKAISMMMEATHIVLLPGWKKSKGARVEVLLAKLLKMTIIYPEA
jgi:hypothetical protein